MQTLVKVLLATAVCAIAAVFLFPLPSEAETTEDKTLSPYFLVKTKTEEGSSVERLPLKHTQADVKISGVIADVTITQIYENTGIVPLEAVYVFPGSTRAAVYGMRMTVGDRVRIAKIKEKSEARAVYTKAKKEGKNAALLEQHRPNVFKMSVANIMPGDTIKVELNYTELLVPESGIYEFVYPAVVGPRYSNVSKNEAPAGEDWVANPYLKEGSSMPYSFGFSFALHAGMPIQAIASPSHELNIRYKDKAQAAVALVNRDGFAGNRDVIIRHQLAGAKISTGLLMYEGEGENFFLMMAEPPQRISPEEMPPRDYVYVLDVSGSMRGFPLNVTKQLMRDLLRTLRPVDTFNVLLFSGTSSLLSERSIPATPQNIQRAMFLIENLRGGGATELLKALERVLLLPREENTSRTVVIATDGYVRVEAETFELIRNNLSQANVFAFGIGRGVNRHLIEGMARAGFGEPFIVTKEQEAAQAVNRFRRYISTPLLTGIELEASGIELYDVEPPSIPDVLAERPVVVFGKFRKATDGVLTLKGQGGSGPFEASLSTKDYRPDSDNSALRYLWARHRIATLGDYYQVEARDARREKIIELGIAYNLLTKFTSFVAVDELVRNPSGENAMIKQPLPLPDGVSNHAVGGIPTVPEPGFYALLGVLLLVLAASVYGSRREQFGMYR